MSDSSPIMADLTAENLELKRDLDRALGQIELAHDLDEFRKVIQTALYDGDSKIKAEMLKRHEEQGEEIHHLRVDMLDEIKGVRDEAAGRIKTLLYSLLGIIATAIGGGTWVLK